MELTDSTRSPLGIDLNEIPTTLSMENPVDCSLEPASAVVSAEEGRGGICGACGGPEVEGYVVVCDGCERGFHLECAGMHGRQTVDLVEWVCSDCVESGVKSKRWPLGKKKRILDINASPPSDADGEATEELFDARKQTPGDNFIGGNGCVARVTYSNFLSAGNRYGSQKLSGITTHTVKIGLEEILLHTQRMDGSFKGVDLGYSTGNLSSSSKFPSQNPSDILLQALREFISGRQGFLEEGWRVELRHSMNSCQPYAVYCSPDGKNFDSMSAVASYLGLISNYKSMDAEIRAEGAAFKERLYPAKRRKLTRSSFVNGFEEKKDLISSYSNECSSTCEPMQIFPSRSDTILDGTEAVREENGFTGFQCNKEGLPVQFEDFFVLSLGHVDARPSYHNVNWISPVGYTSCWHDKLTGSIFICEVSDGGDSGPVFKVRRCSCSVLPIPNGSTILFRSDFGQISGLVDEEHSNIAPYGNDYDNDISIQIILSDPCPPMEHDILTFLGNSTNKSNSVYTCDNLLHEASSIHKKSTELLTDSLDMRDEIGEISVEDRSSSLAWRMMSQKLVDTCSEICKQKGALKFSCKHTENRRGLANWDMMDDKNKMRFSVLEKFFGSPVSINIPSEFHGDDKFDTISNILLNWLDQDRFGLDTEFVQEIIEQLPGVKACSRYEFLKDRSYFTSSLTVGNGLLIAKTKSGIECKNEEVSDGSFGRFNKPHLIEDHDDCPSGKALCLRLPPHIIGDFYQVWEFFGRFHEILGLKRPFFLEELEEELTNPWFDGSSPLEKPEKKIQGTEPPNLRETGCIGGQVLSSRKNPHAFIEMETGSMKEVAQARIASVNYSRCSGVVLTKAHSSLLGVLISELQSKLAAIIDPNFDSGDTKAKRGRKKDADCSIPSKKGKLNTLPINELTWPELARRYILAFLSMDGVLDSADITARESGKVFRCLQGDGGVLCGSLTGVAGMEADALLLAEATKKIFGILNRENDMLTIEDEGSDSSGSCEKKVVSDGTMPEWAKVLEPVRKLPTNVGTRIRRCIYEALDKNPPDWAKKRLEHSISKEVYKGNASGPTKKAVLAVLADVQKEELPQKSDKEKKRKTVLSVSDIIMKQSRIVLRHAAAADDEKVFCNLLGRKLSSIDNDDEGLLGFPGMVSRPLDLRTIDMRLAVGAYSGSHESFLEDVRELWNNVRMAYADQPDYFELAEKLFQNFEALYEKEVVPLVQKLLGYAKSKHLDAEAKREINDIIALTSEVPKAPWDEGVCKVCGVDKDDDSVLLCDTCDAEYHTYCLDPPLSRIPEGNWYCPSCVVSNHMLQDLSGYSEVSGRSRGKKYQGEVTQVYLETLRHLTAVMEEKEYWEYNVDERTFLLKFLCDELLNSALIRQHLEQCAETTAELQQKLRAFSAEWKNLKSREENVAARVAKVETTMLNASGKVKEGLITTIKNNGKFMGQSQGSSSGNNGFIVLSDDVHSKEVGQQESEFNDSDKCPSLFYSEKSYNCNSQFMNPADTDDKIKDHHVVVDNSEIPSQKIDKSFKLNELPLSNTLPQDDVSREIQLKENLQDLIEETAIQSPSSDHQGVYTLSQLMSPQVAHEVPSVVTNELQADNLELNTIKNDILALQDSVTTTESQLLKLTVRGEFLGSDSVGRLYWFSAMPGMHPRIIVDGSFTLHQGGKKLDFQKQMGKNSVLQTSTSSDTEGSKACFPFTYDPNVTMASPQWFFYQTDAEVEELIQWLKDNNPKERELKESILHWQRLRFQDPEQTKNQVQDDCQSCLRTPTSSEKVLLIDCLVTKAAALLEKKYGPCIDSETTEIMRKRGKKARVTSEEKMYRCECLELIWPSRNHCLSCHRTFFTDVEFEEHNDDRCSLVFMKSKEIYNSSKVKVNMKSDIPRKACTSEIDVVGTSEGGCNDMASPLIKFQNEGLVCPFDLEEISSKFMTKDSNKELIQEIGLIGSKGIPFLVPSVSPFLSDPTLMLISPQKEVDGAGNELKAGKIVLSAEANQFVTNAGNDNAADNSSTQSAATGIAELLRSNKPALGCSKQKDKRCFSDRRFSEVGVAHCCVIPQSSLRPLTGKVSPIIRRLKINLLDMEAALPEAALRPSKAHAKRRWAWRAFVKSAETIYEMVQTTIILEDMIKSEYLRNEWWYWSSYSAAAKISTISSLALRIYSLDAVIVYDKSLTNSDVIDDLKLSSIPEHRSLPSSELAENFKVSRKSNKKRKEPDG